MRPRVLLITPPNSYRTLAYIKAAQSLGIDLLVASSGEHALVTSMSGGVHIDLYDPASVARLVSEHEAHAFVGVLATDDYTVELASRIACQLGLPHNPPSATRLSRRKDLARRCLRAAGVPVPDCRLINLTEPLSSQIDESGFPCVVKPLSLSGSRGVIRADNRNELEKALSRIQWILRDEGGLPDEESHSALMERFIPGPEIALEGLLCRGKLQVLAVFDKPDPMEGPFFEETYYVSPSRHDEASLDKVRQRVEQACRAYGLNEGPIHAELRLHAGDAWMMEMASRTIGGDCARLLRFDTGHGLEELVLAQAAGQPINTASGAGAAGVLMIPIPERGILRRVEGVLAARRVPCIEDVQITIREGYELVPLPEGSRYLGFVYARAQTPDVVEQALREAHSKLKIVTAPVLAAIR